MSNIPKELAEFLDDLSNLDRSERIQALIDLSRSFVNSTDPSLLTAQYLVPGCESGAYLRARASEGIVQLEIAIANPQGVSAMSLAATLKRFIEGSEVALARQVPEEIVFRMFGNELSMGKNLGLTNMIRSMKSQLAATDS